MNSTYAAGIALSIGGLVAYVLGIYVDYPGRAFSVTALMVGVTLAAIGRSATPEGSS